MPRYYSTALGAVKDSECHMHWRNMMQEIMIMLRGLKNSKKRKPIIAA